MRCLLNGVLRRPDDFLSKYSMQACVSILDISVRTCGQFIEKIRSSKMDITARTLDKPRFLPPFVSENNSHLWYKSYSVSTGSTAPFGFWSYQQKPRLSYNKVCYFMLS